ncbi:MAG: hypothetical protein LC754_09150 [Acidobacteria bacterium]|nr:hypothetical protein [Acidobacteriota bacterium]
MKMIKLATVLLLIIGGAISAAAQTQPKSKTYPETRKLLLKISKTALIEVVFGNVFTEGWHVAIRREGGKWRLLSNNLVWQS